jgi:hypothetical protein
MVLSTFEKNKSTVLVSALRVQEIGVEEIGFPVESVSIVSESIKSNFLGGPTYSKRGDVFEVRFKLCHCIGTDVVRSSLHALASPLCGIRSSLNEYGTSVP